MYNIKRAEEFFKDKNFRKILIVSKISKRQRKEFGLSL